MNDTTAVDADSEVDVDSEVKVDSPNSFFNTTVILNPTLPSLSILTLPPHPTYTAPTDRDELEWGGRTVPLIGWGIRMRGLHPIDLDTAVSEIRKLLREEMVANPDLYKRRDLFDLGRADISKQAFPVINSPISGTTLAQLFASTGSGAAFLAYFPHPDVGQIATYFAVVGGTKIVFGAADGIGYALKHGLAFNLLRWMGAPTSIIKAEFDRTEARIERVRKASKRPRESLKSKITRIENASNKKAGAPTNRGAARTARPSKAPASRRASKVVTGDRTTDGG